MIEVVEAWLEIAVVEAMPIQFETHRNCITNDLFATLQLLDAIPQMRLSADSSITWSIARCLARRRPRCGL